MSDEVKRVRIIRPGDHDGILIPVKHWRIGGGGTLAIEHPDGRHEFYSASGWLRVMEVTE